MRKLSPTLMVALPVLGFCLYRVGSRFVTRNLNAISDDPAKNGGKTNTPVVEEGWFAGWDGFNTGFLVATFGAMALSACYAKE